MKKYVSTHKIDCRMAKTPSMLRLKYGARKGTSRKYKNPTTIMKLAPMVRCVKTIINHTSKKLNQVKAMDIIPNLSHCFFNLSHCLSLSLLFLQFYHVINNSCQLFGLFKRMIQKLFYFAKKEHIWIMFDVEGNFC